MNNKIYKRKQDSIVLYLVAKYCIDFDDVIYSEQYNDIIPDLSVKNKGEKIAFIFTNIIDKAIINNRINQSFKVADQVCIVIFDSKVFSTIKKLIPKECGILCFSNSFSNGMIYQNLCQRLSCYFRY